MKQLFSIVFLLGSLLAHAQGPPNSITFPAKGDTANRVKDRWTVQIMGRTPYWVPPLGSPYSAFPVRGELNTSLGEIGLVGPIQFDQYYDLTLSGSPTDSVKGLGVDVTRELERIRQAIQLYAPSAGKDGRDGVDGKDGAPGATGSQGVPGAQGIQGLPGVAGPAGKDGSPGSNGVDGSPGAQGIQGVPGVAGSNGVNAYTQTSSAYTNPAVGGTVTVSVGNTAWMAKGQYLYIFNVGTGSQAGSYQVSNVNSLTSVSLTYTSDLPSYTGTVAPGSYVIVSGVRGAAGTPGTQITSGSSLTVSSVFVDTPASSDSARTVATTGWVKAYVERSIPRFFDFPYRSSQFSFSDSLAIRPEYIRSLFSGAGYNPATGVITSSTATGGSSSTNVVTATDVNNTTVQATYLLPPFNTGRIFFGSASLQSYALNYRYVQGMEEYPATRYRNGGLTIGSDVDGGITRVGNVITVNVSSNGSSTDQGFKVFGSPTRYMRLMEDNGDKAPFLFGVTTSGRVGVGVELPKANLDVLGTANVSGNVTVGASVTATGNVKAGSITLADGFPITQFASGNGIDYGNNGTFHLRNSSVVTVVENLLRSYDGYDAAVSKVLSTTGSTFRWIAATTSTGSSTTASTAFNASSYRDSVLINADSTKMRFASSGTTTTNISTVAQLRSFLTTTQTNVRGVLANGVYDDGSPFEQTGSWTNVSLEAANYRQAILSNSGGNLVWINQGGSSRRRVRLKDFVIRSGSTDLNNLAMFHHNELPDWDGLEMDGIELYHTNPTQGKTNGFTFSLYSESSKAGKVFKNLFIHNCYFHDIPRANEILSHGFDIDRVLNVVVTNNRFERTGVNDSYGAPLSYSGRIKYGLTKGNSFKEFNYLATEHVANRFMITASNTYSSTATNGGVAVAISDNDQNLTQYIWVENNTVNVMNRPFYIYGARNVYFSGGTYVGRLGIDGTQKNSEFKNMNITIWPKAGQAAGSVMDYAWQIDGAASGNVLSDLTVSTAGTQANSPGGPANYTIKLNSGTSNNTLTNVTTIIGKNGNNTYSGSGAITNNGTNNTITNNTFSQSN